MSGLSYLGVLGAMLEPPDRIPNAEAIALSPTIGWLMFACGVFAIAIVIAQSERWRRIFLTMEDPRPMALFRIVFAFLVICNVNDVWEYHTMLFTDEGIFFTDVARQVHAGGQFAGFGDGFGGDPYGFFDADGAFKYFLGPKYSLLYFWDSPVAFQIYLWSFFVITTLFMIGWQTRFMSVLSYLLMLGIFVRNPLFWEGTELVYRVFFFYLLVSRCGHAYSVDNWLRCRKLRKAGLLSTRDGPGGGAGVAPSEAHPRGLAAIYRLIPAWPRWLAVLNLGALYAYTGIVKNGGVWARGDALYYALNMDHFYRSYPQELSSIVGLSLFRLATWITHWWEALFPLVAIGLITRWSLREESAPLSGRRLTFIRVCWLMLALFAGAVAVVALPVHMPRTAQYPLPKMQYLFAGAWLGLMLLIGLLWRLLGGPMPVKLGARTITLRLPKFMTREWFCKWVLGRRVWLTLGILFHGNLHLMMNIGQFPTVMLSTYIVYLHGDEPGRILRKIGGWMPRWVPGIPAGVRAGEPPLPAEDRSLPHHIRDDRKLPEWFLFLVLGLIIGGVLLEYLRVQDFGWSGMAIGFVILGYAYYQGHKGTERFALKFAGLLAAMAAYTWMQHLEGDTFLWTSLYVHSGLLALFLLSRHPAIGRRFAAIGLTLSPPDRAPDGTLPLTDPHSSRVRAPWAYGPAGRLVIGGICAYYTVGVAVWLMPDKDSLSKFDVQAKAVFRRFLLTTGTDQQWGMFAPNPPRHNVFMKTVVIEEDGEKWDLRTDLYAPERKPIPWIWNDRMRKMNRRIIGGESGKGDWYQKWYGRYICREWALAHRGRMPKKVELFRISYLMPSPQQVAERGWYVPEELLLLRGRSSRKYTESCRAGFNAQLPNYMRQRYGLPEVDEKTIKQWEKKRLEKWEKRDDFNPEKDDAFLDTLKKIQNKITTEKRKLRR
ncbi:MAG: hypothetical protein R3A51_17340, partial [Nannocystaceae bacterium]